MIKPSTILICLLLSAPIMAQEVPEGYQLVWSDEFNEAGRPDSLNWRFEKGFVRNNELQWYQEDNAWCENGRLIIEAHREQSLNPHYNPDSDNWRESRQYIKYTSGSLNTKGLRDFQYGIIEVRARIQAEQGLWPAIWTLGVEGSWPANGECDIMEFYANQLLANFAWDSGIKHKPIWDSVKIPVSDDFDDKVFHTWKLVWNEEYMAIYLDNELLNDIRLDQTINVSDGRNPFRQPHFILLNLAVGSNGGDPAQTSFPNRYEIDYVRVYQQKSE